MRKLLLASVAALGASIGLASYADAQIVDNTDGQSFPTPGQVTVRLNGRFRFYAAEVTEGAERTTTFAPTAAGVAATANQGINRLSNYGFTEYARLYPGFDGVAANGLKYGASLEIREDNNFGSGNGVYGSTTGQDRTRGILYYRRSWGYIGTDRFGTLRLGSSDGPTSLYLTGTFETFNDGGLNGDLPGIFPGGSVALLNYPFNDVGNMYSTTKAVYLSPQFYGVDFGLSYEPSTAGIGGDNGAGCNPAPQFGSAVLAGATTAATPGCDELSATSTADYARRKNMYEALVRYRGTFGPVGIAATAAYVGSGRVQDDGITATTAAQATALGADAKHQRLEDLSYGDWGLVGTLGGLSAGGNFQYGRYNVLGGSGAGGLLNRGQPNSAAIIVGATYTIGPVIFGAHVLRSWYEGDRNTATNFNQITGASLITGANQVTGGQRRDEGIGAGATYSLAPGVSIYLSYLFGQSRQNGANVLAGSTNVGASLSNPNGNLHNQIDQSLIAIGTSFAW